MTYRLCLVAWSLLVVTTACAQESPAPEECKAEPFDLSAMALAAAPDTTARTEAEARVREIVAQDGVHVVHFWAPWCPNSIAELKGGWYGLVEQNPDVTFTFVTVWNDGASGRETMTRYALPGTVVELTQPDFGPSADKTQRRRQFLDLPVTWIPSTWIFHNNGELAFALNYAEIEVGTLQALLDATRKDWTRD